MSFSPELFLRQGQYWSDRSSNEDYSEKRERAEGRKHARNFRLHDSKDRSENVMIVNLLRNYPGPVLHEAGGGEVTEGAISNVVALSNGIYKTPPETCGLLGGIMRQKILCFLHFLSISG